MKCHPEQLKLSITKAGLSCVVCFSLGTASAGTLNISNDPLFIADSVAPGIFFMMDDSGSMDWEILTSPYYDYEDYYEDSSSLRTDGLFRGYVNNDRCSNGWHTFYYMYDNDDNLYSSCDVERDPSAYDRDWRVKSSEFNVMYYDPAQTYKPWVAKVDDSSNSSAASFPDANFSSVKSNPQPGEAGYNDLKDLDGFIWEVSDTTSYGYCGTSPDGPEADNDHDRCASNSDCNAGVSCTKDKVDLWDSHTRYKINGNVIEVDSITYSFNDTSASKCPSDNDPSDTRINTCFGRVVTALPDITNPTIVNAAKQNVANWYQYNRKRSLVAKSAVASVLESAPFYRFGFSTLHNEFFTPLPSSSVTDYIPHNQDLFNQFAKWNWQAQGTPLRDGLKQAGTYFKGGRSGYNTSSTKPIVHACQQNFSILFTDGYYNSSVSGFSDNDGDGVSSSLADIAYYYYHTDLDAFADIVPTTTFDTQNQQHMVTFSVAFGVTGNLVDTDNDGWPNPLPDGSTVKWYNGSIDSNPERIDDMWHAAHNSRGAFISAKTPAQLVQGLNDALSAIQDRVGSASSAAASTGASVLTETNVFFAYYDSNDWSGDLLAYDITTDAATQVSTFKNSVNASTNFYANTRSKFYSWDPATNSAINFDWASLNATQQAFLNDNPDTVSIDNDSYGDKRVAFIKGDTTYDGVDYTFNSAVRTIRDRNGKTLGDILNSAPQFVGGTLDKNDIPLAFLNSDLTEASSYENFQKNNKNRKHMIYVGANDGMLHGLIVDSDPSTNLSTITKPDATLSYLEDYGKEVFSYIPSAVIKRLNKITSSEYVKKGIASHRYLVDGSPTVEDAYTGSAWKTVLVSGLGGGGQGVYALDVTDGATTNSNAAVLWEFNDSDDADLGYTYSRPAIVRLHDGNWYAVFGNGYNNTETNNMDAIPDTAVSTTGHGVLFLLKLSGPTGTNNSWVLGTDYYKIDTGVGTTSSPNGISAVSTLDYDRDQVVDAIYAGDIEGNLWRFDLLDNNTNVNSGNFSLSSKFKVAYRDANDDPMPVFSSPAGQPITSEPLVASHPIDGFLVIFGTGQYLESGDNQTTGLPTQSFYGIWDNCVVNHKVGNDSKTQIYYGSTAIPSTATACTTISKSELLQQSIVKEEIEVFTEDVNGTEVDKNTEEVRITTGYKLYKVDKADPPLNTQNTQSGTDQHGNTISYFSYSSQTGWLNYDQDAISHRGWYMDMIFNGNNKSERNTNKPILLGGTVFFNTYTPSTSSSCGASGDTWIYSLNASDGRQLAQSAFDLNQDGKIDSQDEFNQVEVIGARKKSGYTPGGTVINAGKKKHSITFGGDINTGDDDIDDTYFKIQEGRQTWRVIK